jgi:uncharacterized protein YgiM (DUF1202 family)
MPKKHFLIISTRESTILLLLWTILAIGCTDRGSTNTLSRSALSPTPSQLAQENLNGQSNKADQGGAVVISTKANLREGPSSTRPILLEVRKGDALNLASRQRVGAWYNVTHVTSGKVGWINGNSIKLSNSQTKVTTAQSEPEYPSSSSSSTQTNRPSTSSSKRPVRNDTAPSGAAAPCSHHGGVAEWL